VPGSTRSSQRSAAFGALLLLALAAAFRRRPVSRA
jgi:MYXO-CTERM domain-containing protein